jgi:CO dehydrogenase/acetyl-CoA synthase beta subunit
LLEADTGPASELHATLIGSLDEFIEEKKEIAAKKIEIEKQEKLEKAESEKRKEKREQEKMLMMQAMMQLLQKN